MWTSLGFRKALKTATQYPAMIMTPAFSYWVFGPIESSLKSTFCCSRTSRLGVSFLHSWINAGVTILGQLLCSFLVIGPSRYGGTNNIISSFLVSSLGFHIISVITLALIQLLERCDSCCISSCCKSTIQRTVLDVDDPNQLIFFRQKENEAREMDDLNNA